MVKTKCSCGKGYVSYYDGWCGNCRSKEANRNLQIAFSVEGLTKERTKELFEELQDTMSWHKYKVINKYKETTQCT